MNAEKFYRIQAQAKKTRLRQAQQAITKELQRDNRLNKVINIIEKGFAITFVTCLVITVFTNLFIF